MESAVHLAVYWVMIIIQEGMDIQYECMLTLHLVYQQFLGSGTTASLYFHLVIAPTLSLLAQCQIFNSRDFRLTTNSVQIAFCCAGSNNAPDEVWE